MKSDILKVLTDLRNNVQNMREEGETDLRSVLWSIDSAITKTNEIFADNSNLI